MKSHNEAMVGVFAGDTLYWVPRHAAGTLQRNIGIKVRAAFYRLNDNMTQREAYRTAVLVEQNLGTPGHFATDRLEKMYERLLRKALEEFDE